MKSEGRGWRSQDEPGLNAVEWLEDSADGSTPDGGYTWRQFVLRAAANWAARNDQKQSMRPLSLSRPARMAVTMRSGRCSSFFTPAEDYPDYAYIRQPSLILRYSHKWVREAPASRRPARRAHSMDHSDRSLCYTINDGLQ